MPEYIIEQGKLIDYLLNPNHLKGGAKCVLFLRYGFKRDTPAELADAVVAHVEANRQESTIVIDSYATKRVVEGPIRTPSGRTPNAVSIWQIMPEGRERLITAYIR